MVGRSGSKASQRKRMTEILRSKKFYLAAAVLIGALLLGAYFWSDQAKTPTDFGLAPGEVGRLTSLQTGEFFTESANGELQPLSASHTFRLGDVLVVSEGAKASLLLVRPDDLSDDPDLIVVSPKPGERYPINIRIERQEDSSTLVTINP